MADPIAQLSLSTVGTITVDDPENRIVVRPAALPDGSVVPLFDVTLVVRGPDGAEIRRVVASVNLAYLVLSGAVDPADVPAWRRVIVAIGVAVAAGAGAQITQPPETPAP